MRKNSQCSLARQRSRAGTLAVLLWASTFIPVGSSAHSDSNFLSFSYETNVTGLHLSFSLAPDSANYYILDEGTNLIQFRSVDMSFGGGSNAWNFDVITSSH